MQKKTIKVNSNCLIFCKCLNSTVIYVIDNGLKYKKIGYLITLDMTFWQIFPVICKSNFLQRIFKQRFKDFSIHWNQIHITFTQFGCRDFFKLFSEKLCNIRQNCRNLKNWQQTLLNIFFLKNLCLQFKVDSSKRFQYNSNLLIKYVL